jgi:hypothetical protein
LKGVHDYMDKPLDVKAPTLNLTYHAHHKKI